MVPDTLKSTLIVRIYGNHPRYPRMGKKSLASSNRHLGDAITVASSTVI